MGDEIKTFCFVATKSTAETAMFKNRKCLAAVAAYFLVCMGCLIPKLALAQSSANTAKVAPPPPILLGAAWYPEQWPE
jgi:hypothetical protein